MLNRTLLQGRIGTTPELRYTQNGTPVLDFRLASERDFKDKNSGERATDWFSVICWGALAEFVHQYFDKGRMIVVDGRLQAREYTDRDGNRRTAVEVVANNVYFSDSKRQGERVGYGDAPDSYVPDIDSH